MAIIFGTGFEVGNALPFGPSNSSSLSVSTSVKKTGLYGLNFTPSNGTASCSLKFPASNEIFINYWHRGDSDLTVQMGFYTVDSKLIYWNQGYRSLYVNGAVVATNTARPWVFGAWTNVQWHVKIDNAPNGRVETWIDGIQIADFTGDTLFGTSNLLDRMYLLQGQPAYNGRMYVDDITIDDASMPPDIRYAVLTATSDVQAQFTPSTGATNYGVVDELGTPNDADYVTATADAKDIYGCSDFDSALGMPVVVRQYVRAMKVAADLTYLKMSAIVGLNENATADMEIATAFTSYERFLTLAPDGNPWSDTALDDLQFGVEAVLP